MIPDDKKHEKRFKCPNCQQPIVSRFTYCKQCETKFGRDTLFSCPRCGALVKQLERVCPGCEARLTDWGVGAEWLSTPLASVPQKVEAPKEIEPGPIISKPLPELKKPEQVEDSPKPTTAPTPLPEIQKLEQIDREIRHTRTPIQKPAPSKIPRAEAMGRTNGLKHGRVNGTKHGGLVNGTSSGRVNGTSKGLVNGNQKGLVNGTRQGRVNGFKGSKGVGQEEEPSLLSHKIAGKIPTWQAVAATLVVILLISSAVILAIQPQNPGQDGIIIDGQFADWVNVPSYKLSELLPGNIPQVIEAKMNMSGSRLNLYMRLQDNAFSGANPSVFYMMIDADSDGDTGYLLADHGLGADRLITLSGWDGHLMESYDSNFSGSSDASNWSAWEVGKYVSIIQSQTELELSLPFFPNAPLLQIATASAGKDYESPVMSLHGTIVAKQESLLSGMLVSMPSQSIIRVSTIAMGIAPGNITATATIANDTNPNLASTVIQVSSSSWSNTDFSLNLSSLTSGDSFSMRAVVTSSAFSGTVDVNGDTVCGYYLSIPTNIVIDGAFGDWMNKKISDTDSAVIENPNIDIAEYGADTQNGSHFFYISIEGDALGGTDIPEERGRSTPGGGGQPPVVRLRKTGEDLLQVFIDKDPGNGTGQVIFSGNKTIGADYLVEMFGRKGHVTTKWVMQWSSSTQEWAHISGFGKVSVEGQGIELSVNKSALGNLTAAQMIILTTDWKAESDNCWFQNALSDPWAITTTGWTKTSSDGITWSYPVGISLTAGDTVVAIAHSLDFDYAFAVTNTGRAYSWEVGVSTSWGTNVTNPANATNIVGIAPYSKNGPGGAYILAADGRLWYVGTLSGTGRTWIYNTAGNGRVANNASITDFKDIDFKTTGGRYFAIRSGSNTPVYYAGTAFTWTATSATGSSTAQSHIYHPGGNPIATEEIFVICQDGSIRYSSNGGSTWAARGNLPAPGAGSPQLQSYAKYVAIDRDEAGTFWAITNTSYCYRSLDTGSTWTYRGSFAMKNVTSMACPTGVIPEFDSLLIPMIVIAVPVIAVMRKRRMQP